MLKIPSMSSKKLLDLLEKGGQYLLGKVRLIMQYIRELLKAKDILRLSRWGKRHWTPYIAKGFLGS
jgi:hypothetical protein